MSEDEERNEEQAENRAERGPVRITPEGVTNRPELRARARETDEPEGEGGEEMPELESAPNAQKGKKPVRKVSLPSQADREDRMAFATHRPAPGDKEAKPAPEPTGQGRPPESPAEGEEREISAPFVLGVVIIVIALVLGGMLARLDSRIDDLERNVNQLQNASNEPAP